MENNQFYKNRALESLEGKWTIGVVAALIAVLISQGVSILATTPMGQLEGSSFSCLWAMLCLPLSWGFSVFFLNLIRNNDIRYERLFDGYRDIIRIGVTELLRCFFIAFGFILFIVPGVILGLMFSQTSFIMKDDPNIGYIDAMMKSAQMMKGHKWRLFWLTPSFTGWIILACLSLGIGFLMLAPYWFSTTAHFYEDLKAEANRQGSQFQQFKRNVW